MPDEIEGWTIRNALLAGLPRSVWIIALKEAIRAG
jgi:hypothetical protein